ncbi:protein TIC236, chloroplastic [Aristolochia californica]|uniref:protein TIC236, chloroplastic n=1 Tax=Aristolochia californica TaxID=171875 RepID=UPI0035DC0CED
MSLDSLHSPLLGNPLSVSVKKINNGYFRYTKNMRHWPSVEILCAAHSSKNHKNSCFLHFAGRRFKFASRSFGNRLKMNCTREPFSRSKALSSSFVPLWKEGLFFIRCSIFVAALSAIGMLVWYGQISARSFIEIRLLPSVCTILSEYLQRELNFGKVRSVSPLSVSLDSCSIGPHDEEFSCGEVNGIRLRVRPFASLRRGKIVIDAVLSQPNVLVVQKKNFSWLGIGSSSEGGLMRHHSTEEGIDYRTKVRRLAKEEAVVRWAHGRNLDALEAAKLGYIFPKQDSIASVDNDFKDAQDRIGESSASGSFLCPDKRMHWKDNHCKDNGLEYSLKHADLEESFGMKTPGSGLKFWSRLVSSPMKDTFKRKACQKEISTADATVRHTNLERSRAAALAYFQSQDVEKVGKNGTQKEGPFPLQGNDEETSIKTNSINAVNEQLNANNVYKTIQVDETQQYELTPSEFASASSKTNGSIEQANNCEMVQGKHVDSGISGFSFLHEPFHLAIRRLSNLKMPTGSLSLGGNVSEVSRTLESDSRNENRGQLCVENKSEGGKVHTSQGVTFSSSSSSVHRRAGFSFLRTTQDALSRYLSGCMEKLKSCLNINVEYFAEELAEGVNAVQNEGIEKILPVTLDSIYFTGGTLMLLGYGDREPREMQNVAGHVRFQNHYGRVHVQLDGTCKEWRSGFTSSGFTSKEGGFLSADVFVDNFEQKWHANLKVTNIFAPLFERILDIPIVWSKGRASGEVHICMSKGETFPNLHGQLDVSGLAFQIIEAPSSFSEIAASLCFRGQRLLLHNASGWFGDAPLEVSGDFGLNPEDGEFHLMCQVPCVEVNALMKTFRMKPLFFPVAGSVTAVFNCQGPLDAPIFVGSGAISRRMAPSVPESAPSSATETLVKNKDAGAVAAFDRVPFSNLSANFTFNLDNSVADLYGIRANLLDGGEIRGAGYAWICPEGEVDDSAMDINLSGNLAFDRVIHRYLPCEIQLLPLKIGEINGGTRLSGSLSRPRFDIKWAAPKAEESFTDARGDIIISHESIIVTSSSIAFDINAKVQASYPHDWLMREDGNIKILEAMTIEGIELDLRMRGFEFFGMISPYSFDLPRPMHLKATGRVKFHGEVVKVKPSLVDEEEVLLAQKNVLDGQKTDIQKMQLVGEVSLAGIKVNQLMLAPQLAGTLSVSNDNVKLDATGRPDESLTVEITGPLRPNVEDNLQKRTVLIALQKGQLKFNVHYQPQHSTNLEVRYLPLDELELASLRGTIQRAELQLNFLKRKGHGMLNLLHPKFSGVLGESLDLAARWSGDVITIEKTVLEQAISKYEIQGEYVLPGSRDRYRIDKERNGLLKRVVVGDLGSVMSSMGRWRMRLEVPRAEVSEMLPLARLLSRSTDPAVRSRSKDLFMRSLQSVGFYTEILQDLLEAVRRRYVSPDEIILEDITLPGLAELKGRWNGSLDASGGGNGDTLAEFIFHGEDWEWGSYRTQRVEAEGAFSNNNGLRLDQFFIQKENATLHADGTVLGPKNNLHFAVLNFPVGLVPALVQIIESSTSDIVHSLRQLLAPIKGILHMEGDLRGSLAKPECDVQVRLLDGVIGGIDLGRAEVVASVTPTSRFLFSANIEPIIQSGHVHIQGSVPVTCNQSDAIEEESGEIGRGTWFPSQAKVKGSIDGFIENKVGKERNEEGWDVQLAAGLKGLNWNVLDSGEVRIDADVKDGGMMLLTALCPYADWLQGNADIFLEVRGTVEKPLLNGSASFHRASVSSPVLRRPLTNIGGTVHVKSNRLSITSLESRVGRKGKLLLKGNLPLQTTEQFSSDRIDLKCEVLEVRAKNILSGQVDSQIQIAGSIMQPNVSGMIQLSHGEAYLPHDKGNGAETRRITSSRSILPSVGYNRMVASEQVSPYLGLGLTSSSTKFPQPSDENTEIDTRKELENVKPSVDVRLTDLKLLLGPELRIVYPLILNFAVSGELELNGIAHPKRIRPKGILTFENGDINLVATQVRLKRDHLNVAKFDPEAGLNPTLDLALVGSEWQFRIQSRASNWQDNLVVISTRSVEQDVLSSIEAARVFESQLAGSLLERDGQLAFKKLATATLETLMPRIEGKGEFGQARWRVVYAPQIPSLPSLDASEDPLKLIANTISFGTEVEVQLGKRLQASVVRQMKDSEMAVQWTLLYQLTSRLRVLVQIPSKDAKRILFEYSATSQE